MTKIFTLKSMDAEAVHQRDVASILSQLQDDMASLKEKYKDIPNGKDQLNKEIQELIANADRDLRLKTQAIVRARLSQSRALPVNAVKDAVIERRRVKSTLNKPLPPLEPVKPPSLDKTLDSLALQPIGPIDRREQRLCTSVTPVRTRHIPENQRISLPRRDFHDPGAPLPEIDPKVFKKYGLNQLNESGLISESTVKQQLDGLITVSPFVYDFTKSIPRVQNPELYVLDTESEAPTTPHSDRSVIEAPTPMVKSSKMQSSRIHLRLQFINGDPLTYAQDYRDFRRENTNVWEQIEVIFQLLKHSCNTYGFSKVQVDGNAVLDLLQYDPDEIAEDRLMLCFIDIPPEKKRRKCTKIGVGFVGPNAENKAATVIQSVWRGFYARREVRMIRRTSAAVRIIQRWYRNMLQYHQLKKNLKIEVDRRINKYAAIHQDSSLYDPDMPHVSVHLVDGHSSVEFGRLIELRNRGVILIIFTRKQLPTATVEEFKKMSGDQKVHFFTAQQRLPKTLPIEDVIASDSRTLTKIKNIAGTLPIIIRPKAPSHSLVEVSVKLNAHVMAPAPIKVSLLSSREAIRRLFENAKLNLFKATDVIFDRFTLCQTLAQLSIDNLEAMMWMLRMNTGDFAWIATEEMALLEKMRDHKAMLSDDDLKDPHFKELIAQNILNDLPNITNTIPPWEPKQFLSEVWEKGAVIEEAPTMIRSNPSLTIFVPPAGQKPVCTASWERLYISAFEEFAKIYPAFMEPPKELKAAVKSVASELAQKEIIGYSTVNFTYSTHQTEDKENRFKMSLFADSINICSENELLSQWLAEYQSKTAFDDEKFIYSDTKVPKFIYLQENLKVPKVLPFNELYNRMNLSGLPVHTKISFVHDMTDPYTLGLIVVDDSPSNLINLVYNTLCVLAMNVYDLENDPHNILFTYIQAIEFLRGQLTTTKILNTTVLMKRTKKGEENKKVEGDNNEEMNENFVDEDKDDEKEEKKETETEETVSQESQPLPDLKDLVELDNDNTQVFSIHSEENNVDNNNQQNIVSQLQQSEANNNTATADNQENQKTTEYKPDVENQNNNQTQNIEQNTENNSTEEKTYENTQNGQNAEQKPDVQEIPKQETEISVEDDIPQDENNKEPAKEAPEPRVHPTPTDSREKLLKFASKETLKPDEQNEQNEQK